MGQHTRFWYLSPLINVHTDVSRRNRGLILVLAFVYESNNGSSQSAHMHADSPEPLLLADVISTEKTKF